VDTISELAARWAVRADAGPLNPDEQQMLESWLNADSRHRGAYVRARAQWVDLDRLAALHGPAVDDTAPSAAPTSPAPPAGDNDGAVQRALWMHAPPTITSSLPQHGSSMTSISRRQLLAASVAAIAIVGAGLSWRVLRGGKDRYTSGIGEVRRIALADGSTMLLNTDTEVAVQLSMQQREIRLIRGEALFEVAHDKARPFIVRANDTAVRAVGTAFAVRVEPSQVDVTVTEGVVEVSDRTTAAGSGPVAPAAPRPPVQRVAANERIVIRRTRAPEIEPIAIAAVNRQLAWREGMVSFDGDSLQTAVAEINRHNRRQIVIDDPLLGAKPIVGVFRATDLEGFSATAAAVLKARAVPDGDVIRLEPTAAPTLH